MEAITEHVLEPELLLPVPRRLSLPGRTWLLLSVAALLLGLCVLGSGCALWEGLKLSWLDLAGQTVSGRITAVQAEPSPPQSASTHVSLPRQTAIRYEASIPSPHGVQARRGWIVLGTPDAPGIENERAKPSPVRFHIGQPFPLRCAFFFGLTVCQPWGPNPGSRIASLLLSGSLVMAVSLRLLRRLSRWAGSRRFLLQRGTATVGTITYTRSETEDMMRYFLRYGYAGGAAFGEDREEQVSADHWHRFEVGQPVTILYDPHNPSHAGLYVLMKR